MARSASSCSIFATSLSGPLPGLHLVEPLEDVVRLVADVGRVQPALCRVVVLEVFGPPDHFEVSLHLGVLDRELFRDPLSEVAATASVREPARMSSFRGPVALKTSRAFTYSGQSSLWSGSKLRATTIASNWSSVVPSGACQTRIQRARSFCSELNSGSSSTILDAAIRRLPSFGSPSHAQIGGRSTPFLAMLPASSFSLNGSLSDLVPCRGGCRA